MDWLEEAGWSYDPESVSIEQVEYGSAAWGVIPFAVFAVGIPIIFFDGLTNPDMFIFVLVYASCLGFSILGGFLISNKGTVKRIALSDLSYTVMKRNKRTLEDSKINTLESTDRFRNENLEVIVVLYLRLVASESGTSYTPEYQVRLVEKRLVGDTRYFTHREEWSWDFGKNDSTLHPDLRVNPLHLATNHGNKQMKWNYGNDPAYDVQRMLVLKAKNKTHALELRERFREFFIEGGWKELTGQPSPRISNEATEEESKPFWE